MALSHSPSIVTDGLVLCLDAANRKSYLGTGTAWNDLSGNNINGTFVNGVTFSSSNLGSIFFDGSDDYISYPSNLNVSNTFTLNFWIRPTTKTRQTIFSNAYPYSTNNGFLMLCPGNNATDMFLSLGQDQKMVVAQTNTIVNNTIQMITATANGSASLMKLYINGTEITNYQRQDDANLALEYNTGVFTTGVRNNANADYLNSNVYLLQIYNRALSLQEISQNFNALRGRFGI